MHTALLRGSYVPPSLLVVVPSVVFPAQDSFLHSPGQPSPFARAFNSNIFTMHIITSSEHDCLHEWENKSLNAHHTHTYSTLG